MGNAYKNSVENMKGKDHSEDLGVIVRIILKKSLLMTVSDAFT
jgi:hypothetical protein